MDEYTQMVLIIGEAHFFLCLSWIWDMVVVVVAFLIDGVAEW